MTRGVERLELLLEPLEVLDVEVVRRLVQEQQVGITGEGARQGGAGQLAAGKGLERPVEVRLRETESSQRLGSALAPGVAARMLEPRLGVRVAPQRPGPVVSGGHRLFERAELLLGLDEVARAAEGVLAQAQPVLQRRPLVVEGDARPLRERELASVAFALAHEHAQQRRLAGAVWPGKGQSVAALDRERDALEQQRAGKLLAQIGGGDDCHDRSLVLAA